jgi:hypothetical protein
MIAKLRGMEISLLILPLDRTTTLMTIVGARAVNAYEDGTTVGRKCSDVARCNM